MTLYPEALRAAETLAVPHIRSATTWPGCAKPEMAEISWLRNRVLFPIYLYDTRLDPYRTELVRLGPHRHNSLKRLRLV
jgi:hypothetical protein